LYVNDYANIFSQGQRDELTQILYSLATDTASEAVVVTIDSLGGSAPIDYATKLGQEWGVGKKEIDNGLVILYAKAENKIAVAVGYGLEGILPDSKVGRILDEQYVPLRDANKIPEGIIAATKEYVLELCKNEGEIAPNLEINDWNESIPLKYIFGVDASYFFGDEDPLFLIIAIIVFCTFILLIVIAVFKNKQGSKLIIKIILGAFFMLIGVFLPDPFGVMFIAFGFFIMFIGEGTSSGGGYYGGHSGGSFGGGSSFGGSHSFGGGSFGGGGASR
jgi:uncharacterized protein